MSASGVEPISTGPLGLIDLLDGSFAALRQRARVIVTIVAGLLIPQSLLAGWVARDDLGGASFNDLINDPTVAQEVSSPADVYDAGFFLSQGLALLVVAIGGVAVSRVVHGWFQGEDLTASEALSFTVRRLGATLVAFVIIHVLELGALVLLLVPNAATLLLMFVLLAPGLAVMVLSSLTSPVLAIEDLGPVASIRRSWQLIRRRAGIAVLVLLLLGATQYGVSQAVGTLPTVAALFIGPDRAWPLVSLATLITSIIAVPVNGAAMCLLYLDIRFRTEGLDLQRRIDRVLPATDPTEQPAS